MRYSLYNMILRGLLMLLAVALPSMAFAEDDLGNVDADESAAMAKSKEGAIVWQETDPTGANYLSARRALVGRNCAVNRVINVVAVGTGTSGLENLTNEDIDDYATFPQVISATVAVSPTVSVRDLKYYYAAGTTAGFCIVAGAGSVLNLDIVKTMHIWFYKDGVRVDDKTVREANGGAGVRIQLGNIPGSDQACANLTAVSDKEFDEVALVQGGAVDAAVGSVMMIKYAFVGDNHDVYMTTNGIKNYCEQKGLPTYAVACDAFMPSPLVGGIPIPMASSARARVIDDNLDNRIALVSAVQLASVAFKGRVRLEVTNDDKSLPELFEAGDQVGFKYDYGEALNLISAGTWVDIKLYDHNGDATETITIPANVLAVGIASGGDQTAYVTATKPFSGAEITFYNALGVLDVGSGYGVYYGFVRPKATIDHKCQINPSASTNICYTQTSLQLKHNPEVSVTWSIVKQPAENANQATVDPNTGFLSGMFADGEYIIRATSTDGNEQCYEDLVINHGDSEDFLEEPVEHVLYNADPTNPDYALSDNLHGETSANLLSISDMTNPDNILSAQFDDAASYTGGLQLLGSNGVIVGIKKLDASDPYIYDGSKASAKESVRVGFVIEMEQTALGLNLLNSFQIRCYDETGARTYSHIVEDAGVLGLNVVSSNEKNNKLRLSITVPKTKDGVPVKINEIQLWKIGAIDLKVSDIKIYYGFWDDPTDAKNNIIRDGATVVTYEGMGANVNLGTQVNVASVGGVTTNLSNIIDIDEELETYCLMQKTVESGSTTIIVKLGRVVDFRHQVGVVVNNDIVALNANLGSVLKIATYYNGTKTGEESTNWNVLGANVIQGSGKTVLLVQPTSDYDEIRIIAGEGLAANRTIKIYGILLRNDVDHDGVPDNRDESSCSDAINAITVSQVCEGGQLAITAEGTTATVYYISLPDQDLVVAEGEPGVKVTSNESGHIYETFTVNNAGRYTMYFYDGSGVFLTSQEYTVHPTNTTWRKNITSKDWNVWENWTEGSPYLCTNVVIPSGANSYPSLDETVTKGDLFGCNNIRFESGAAVEKVFKLNYAKAWVDLTLEPNRYYMLSAPLKSMYTGDMYIPVSVGELGTFEELTDLNYTQNRFAPRVYQRLWEKSAQNLLSDGGYGNATIQETRWSKRFNALKYGYSQGEGFSLFVAPEENTASDFTFRFPKNQTAYYYFNEMDKSQSEFKEIGLDRTDNHRFIYESDATKSSDYSYTGLEVNERSLYNRISSISVTAEAQANTTTFLVGNPFMSHINVEKFLAANSEKVAAVKVFNGSTTASAVSIDGTGTLVTNDDLTTIRPMEAFFVTAKAEATHLDIVFTEDMFYREVVDEDIEAERASVSALKITAESDGLKASALLVDDEVEVAETLFDNEALPKLAVFTLDSDRALDIRKKASKEIIPIGVYVDNAKEVKLSFSLQGDMEMSDYVLLDRETGITYNLNEDVPTFEGLQTTMNRFALVPGAVTGIDLATLDGVSISVSNGKAIVKSGKSDLRNVSVFAPNGRLVSQAHGTAQVTVDVTYGVNLIRVERDGAPTRSYKVLAD